jgi:murein DD-endopeptidase
MGAPLVDAARFLFYAFSKEGCSYLWDGKGPNTFDCSGLITWALKAAGGPDWRYTHNAQVLADVLEPCETMLPGEVLVAFYGKDWDHVGHVMVVVGDGRVYGACGGDSRCTTVEKSAARQGGGARVRFRGTPDYRPERDLLGFRRLQYRAGLAPGAPHA